MATAKAAPSPLAEYEALVGALRAWTAKAASHDGKTQRAADAKRLVIGRREQALKRVAEGDDGAVEELRQLDDDLAEANARIADAGIGSRHLAGKIEQARAAIRDHIAAHRDAFIEQATVEGSEPVAAAAQEVIAAIDRYLEARRANLALWDLAYAGGLAPGAEVGPYGVRPDRPGMAWEDRLPISLDMLKTSNQRSRVEVPLILAALRAHLAAEDGLPAMLRSSEEED